MVLVRVAGITVSYGSHRALSNVSLEIMPGEVVSVVGPNGSGKTTLLRAIDGILRPQGGSVYIDGRDVRSYVRRELARLVGYVPQGVGAVAHLTVLEFVMTGRRPHAALAYSERDLNKALEALRLVGAEGLAPRRLDRLSGGELQRVAIARALAAEPRVLLLDEPTANLDPKHQLEVLGLVRGLAKGRGVAVVMALHDLTHAYRFSDKVVMLRSGEVAALGPPEEVITSKNIERVFGVKAIVNAALRAVILEP